MVAVFHHQILINENVEKIPEHPTALISVSGCNDNGSSGNPDLGEYCVILPVLNLTNNPSS